MINRETICQFINPITILGSNISVFGVSSIHIATSTDLSFYDKNESFNSHAGIILCSNPNLFEGSLDSTCLIITDEPRMDFINCVNKFFVVPIKYTIHDQAIIECGTLSDISVGALSVIEKNVSIGQGTIVGNQCTIGEGTKIGENCLIQHGAKIGCEGQGYAWINEQLIQFPQLGSVEIGDNVDIGANTIVLRGTLDNTKIGNGSKIGNLCNIGHNAIIENNVYISGYVIVGGSTVIHDSAKIWMGVVIKDWLDIGSSSIIGMGSVVNKNVESGTVVFGVPAKVRRSDAV